MSERKARFRIRKGEMEIEYEGSSNDVNNRYNEAFEWLKTVPIRREKKTKEHEEEKKEGKRGGARKSLFSPKIDELIKDDFFKLPNKRKVEDVIKDLQEKGLPVVGKKKAILEALKRRLDKTLKGTKSGREWFFWTE